MSVGNLIDYGNKGSNFPYQLGALKLAAMSQFIYCGEITLSNTSVAALATDINNYFVANPTSYLVSKQIIYVGTTYTAFLTVSKVK
jgi:hypothetical protein